MIITQIRGLSSFQRGGKSTLRDPDLTRGHGSRGSPENLAGVGAGGARGGRDPAGSAMRARPWPSLAILVSRAAVDFCSEVVIFSAKSRGFQYFWHSSSHHNSAFVAPIRACSISKCLSRRVHHFISLHHFNLSSSGCPKCCWKRAM